jgi:glycosyltransferase involved in cell wall biosynthesis
MNSKVPFVSVIVPTYNMKGLLNDTIQALFNQSYPKDHYEIIIVDNSSTDGTDKMVHAVQASSPCALKYFKKEDHGPGVSRNFGIEKAHGDIIAFTDSDCVADNRWIEKGIEKMDEGIGLVQGKTLPNPSQTIRTFSRTQEIVSEDGIYQTCNMFYRREAFERAGGFSHDFMGRDRFGVPIMGGEDMDLAWKIKKLGWKSVFADGAIVYHHVFDRNPWRLVFNYQKCHIFFYAWPMMVKKHTDIRNTMLYLKLFRKEEDFIFFIFLVAIVSGILFHQVFFLLAFPYSVQLLGFSFYRRPLKKYPTGFIVPIIIFLKDLVNFVLLLSGSIWHRSLVL